MPIGLGTSKEEFRQSKQLELKETLLDFRYCTHQMV